MVKQTIQVFARIKPTKVKTGLYEIEEDDNGNPQLNFTIPKDIADGLVNNRKELHKFRFERVFDRASKQEEIFEYVSKPVIDNVLQGYNGTLFAYGQTGSGKTFTITGGAERYSDRGIIPRSLSYIFQQYEKNPDLEYTMHVSYLELYNESGYDLLDPKHEAAKLEDLPKVLLMEDTDANVHLKNLSTHQANNEEEALNLLFLGDTNRMIAETPMNQASTRSHCIFTIHITSREVGSAVIRRAKLHLVDLAGSERVSKTGVNGILLTEAKYINLSLHFLEQVIVALSEKGRGHIPYRNSMMTSVLRDSLGGNCMTSMIATCSVEKKNLDESISTCRFAQRVAMIKNNAVLNEELDPKLMIQKLKREVAQLKEELAMATGEQRGDDLTDNELDMCKKAVQDYIDSRDVDATLSLGADMRKIQYCFSLMKKLVLEKPVVPHTPVPVTPDTSRSVAISEIQADTNPKDLKKLRDLIAQRDNEINILVNMLKKEKKRAADAISNLERLTNGSHDLKHSLSSNDVERLKQIDSRHSSETSRQRHDIDSERVQNRNSSGDIPIENGRPSHRRPHSSRREHHGKQPTTMDSTQKKILGDMSLGRQEAFEIYRRDYEHNIDIEDNKLTLKQRYAEAKRLGQTVNQARGKINHIKSQIEQHRMSQAMQGLVDPDNPQPDDVEQGLRQVIEDEKNAYKESFSRLKVLKTEIEHLQHLLEKQKVKLMKSFEIWWAEQSQLHQPTVPEHKDVRSAWKTPPLTPIKRSDAEDNSPDFAQTKQNPSMRTYVKSGQPRSHNHHASTDNKPSRSVVSSSQTSMASSIQMTGDAQADADIMAFMKARQHILNHAQERR